MIPIVYLENMHIAAYLIPCVTIDTATTMTEMSFGEKGLSNIS